jgi:hypothetical protein
MSRPAIDPETLLAGPRGRRVCWALMSREGAGWWREQAPESDGPARLAQVLSAQVDRVDVDAIANASDPFVLWEALEDSVYAARYWQEPDACDRRLGHPDVSSVLRPVAEAVGCAVAAEWWATPVNPAQCEVIFDLPAVSARSGPVAAGSALADWKERTVADELRSADRPDDPRAPYSGAWWSTPALSGLVHSTRPIGSRGPVGLSLVEDAGAWIAADVRALQVHPAASVLEIGGPNDWLDLVDRYPLVVPRSRRHDWWRATGEDGHWVIPDYQSAAADYDGIHLSVAGYLSTAGRALHAEDFDTVLAGWDPDETWWLTDAVTPDGPRTRWCLDDESLPIRWQLDAE